MSHLSSRARPVLCGAVPVGSTPIVSRTLRVPLLSLRRLIGSGADLLGVRNPEFRAVHREGGDPPRALAASGTSTQAQAGAAAQWGLDHRSVASFRHTSTTCSPPNESGNSIAYSVPAQQEIAPAIWRRALWWSTIRRRGWALLGIPRRLEPGHRLSNRSLPTAPRSPIRAA